MEKNTTHLPFVSILIVTSYHRKFLEPCLNSILKTNYPSYEVIVVDNNSTDGSAELLGRFMKEHPNLRVIRNERNLGHAEGLNIGVNVAKGEYIGKLDVDTVVDPNWLSELITVVLADPTIGVAQSGSYEYDLPELKPYQTYSADLDYWGRIHFRHVESIEEVFHPTMFGCVFKKSLYLRVGGLFPDYFAYYEEVDFGWKLRLFGYKCVVVPSSVVRHKGPAKGVRPICTFHAIKNQIANLAIHYNTINLLSNLPGLIGYLVAEASYNLISRKDAQPLRYTLKAFIWNLLNIKNTCERRKFVNSQIRRVPDTHIKSSMIKPLIHMAQNAP